jgi:hypothetical protein
MKCEQSCYEHDGADLVELQGDITDRDVLLDKLNFQYYPGSSNESNIIMLELKRLANLICAHLDYFSRVRIFR